ncbi:MAG: nucleotide exchange factor GrpE [Gordonia sp. (in: high G+C Gram-positive bacteria)]|uniref:hypothetical protein n=1 Tax=Gordonia sp. (in: high G+C Gram-positive bacteria) TaxID=84139 RepID=UPI0039E4F7A3
MTPESTSPQPRAESPVDAERPEAGPLADTPATGSAEPTAKSDVDDFIVLHSALTDQSRRLTELSTTVEQFNTRSAAREAVLKDLAEQNRLLLDQLARTAVQQVTTRLQSLHDDLIDDAAASDGDVASRFETYAVEIEELLADEGITASVVEEGEPFDARRHRVVGRVPTDDSTRDRTVAEARGRLYTNRESGKTTGLARVKIYKFEEKEELQ